jgi:hypothetical protein
MLNREKIIDRAYYECLKEMYAKSQPSVDYDQLLSDFKEGRIGKDECVYERYYLSYDEFKYILNKYIDSYGMKEHWNEDITILEEYLNNGGTKDKYIESYTDEDGFRHSGYRGYEKVKPIKEQIREIIIDEIGEGDISEKIINRVDKVVMDTISDCKDFYRFDREESNFSCSVALGSSPSSNPSTAIEYWKSQGVDIEIVERNPLLLWERDYYGDEFEEVMVDEYGKDWEKIWNDKWLAEKEKKEKEKSEILK